MDYASALNETRTNAEQSETEGDLRISFESDALYFIRVKDGPVKIGRTSLDPLRRMAISRKWVCKSHNPLAGVEGLQQVSALNHLHCLTIREAAFPPLSGSAGLSNLFRPPSDTP